MGDPRLVAVDSDTLMLPAAVQAVLDNMYNSRYQLGRTSVQIDAGVAADNSYEYEAVTVRAPGQQINRVFEKVYPNDYEKTWTSGAFAPGPATDPIQMAKDTSAYVLLSGDAYETSKMTGVQIKNGILYSGWGSANSGTPGLGIEALAFMKDGTYRTYKQSSGVTPEQMVADGVHTTYGFGPIVAEGGNVRDITVDAQWSFFVSSLSARSILGRKPNGDVVYIAIKGKSGTNGAAGNTMGQLALALGCDAAILLDGGGTTQGVVEGRRFHPSSDTGGVRNLRCGIAVHAAPLSPIRIDWVNLTLQNSFTTPVAANPLAVSKTGNRTRLRGTLGLTSAVANTWYTVATLPERFRPDTPEAARFSKYSNQNGYNMNVVITPDGVVQVKFPVVGTTGTVSWGQIDEEFIAQY